MMQHLFAYGTLMCDDILKAVTGCSWAHSVAILEGYRRHRVLGEDYPALLPHTDDQVEGVVYYDVSDLAWNRLDRFEGDMYQREDVSLSLTDGTVLPAVTYVARAECREQLDSETWSFADFIKEGKARFIQTYRGYENL